MSLQAAAAPLAASDTGKGSPIGLFVVLLLVIAVYLLYRSMTGHIRRLPEKFPGYQAEADDSAGPDTELPVTSPPPAPAPSDSLEPPEPPGLRPERPA